jgi:hypothetical protein
MVISLSCIGQYHTILLRDKKTLTGIPVRVFAAV